jgi:hypothetical protein
MSKDYFDIIKHYWDKPHTADLEARARYRAEGAQHEQERIIKVLKEHGKSEWCGEPYCPRPFPTEHLIALIKGENK